MAQLNQKVVTVHAGHVDVEHDQVGRYLVERSGRLGGVGVTIQRGVAGVFKRPCKHAYDARLVVDDKDVSV
jgi:PII-like signaling protein